MPSRLSNLVDNLSEINNKVAKHAEREKMLNQNVNSLGLRVIDWIADAKNAMEYLLSQ